MTVEEMRRYVRAAQTGVHHSFGIEMRELMSPVEHQDVLGTSAEIGFFGLFFVPVQAAWDLAWTGESLASQ
jgi:hypothetical protein